MPDRTIPSALNGIANSCALATAGLEVDTGDTVDSSVDSAYRLDS